MRCASRRVSTVALSSSAISSSTSRAASRQRSVRLVISLSGASRWIASWPKIVAASRPTSRAVSSPSPAIQRAKASVETSITRATLACAAESSWTLPVAVEHARLRLTDIAAALVEPRSKTNHLRRRACVRSGQLASVFQLLLELVLIHRRAISFPALRVHPVPGASSARDPAILYRRNGISVRGPKDAVPTGRLRITPFLAASLRLH